MIKLETWRSDYKQLQEQLWPLNPWPATDSECDRQLKAVMKEMTLK